MDYQPRTPGNGDYRQRRSTSAHRQVQNGRSARSPRHSYDSYEDAHPRRSARASSDARRQVSQRGEQYRRATVDTSRERVHSRRTEQAEHRAQVRNADAGPRIRQRNAAEQPSLGRKTVSSFGYEPGQASRPFSYSDNNPIQEGFSLGIDSGAGNRRSWNSQGGYSAPYRKRPPWIPILIAVVVLALIAFLVMNVFKGCSSADARGKANQNQPVSNQTMAVADQSAPVTTKITLTFAGDCTLGTDEGFSYEGGFTQKYDEVDDPSWFLANVREVFQSDDATIVNMEGTLTESTSRADKTFAFKAPAEYVKILTSSDVQAASMANNHSHDYGEQSYRDTINTMEEAGIPTFGYDRVAILDVKGVKVGLVGSYFPGDSEQNEQQTVDGIHKAREEGAQVVIVYAHWGIELDYVPDGDQIAPAHRFVDEGADFVVGSHPHVVQGCETYNGTNIVYSLGNFCFGGSPHPRDPDCMMVQKTFTITNGQLVPDDEIRIIPCCSSSAQGYNNYQPVILSGSEADAVMDKINESSRAIPSV